MVNALDAAPIRFRACSYFGRELLRAAEHQVFEQVREAGVSRFHLVARAGLHHDVQRHDIGEVRRDRDQAQAVRQILLRVGIGEDLRAVWRPAAAQRPEPATI